MTPPARDLVNRIGEKVGWPNLLVILVGVSVVALIVTTLFLYVDWRGMARQQPRSRKSALVIDEDTRRMVTLHAFTHFILSPESGGSTPLVRTRKRQPISN